MTTTPPKDAEKPAAEETIVQKVAKFIPGLGSVAPAKKQGKTRSRARGGKGEGQPGESSLPEPVEVAPNASKPTLDLSGASVLPEEPPQPLKRPSSAQTVTKRIRAAQKKIQRIQGYKTQEAALNADQQKAVATLPSLEAVVKELSEIAKTLETEEADFEKQITARSAEDEKRIQHRVALATKESQRQSQSDLTLLLQFFHLNSLFATIGGSGSGFAPANVPPVVSSATGQEGAAVRTLAEAIINGPLMGGDEDAFDRIAKIHKGDSSDVIEETDARVKQMILDLTANPLEVAAHEGHVDEAGLGAFGEQANGYHEVPAEEHRAQSHTLSTNPSQLTFMQASELEPANQQPEINATEHGYQPVPQSENKVDYHQDSAAPEVQQQNQPLMDITNTMATTHIDNAPVDPLSARETQPINSWADEVDQATAPPAPAEMANTGRGGRRGGYENRGRGMRGGFRGRPQQNTSVANSENRPANSEGWSQVGGQSVPHAPRGRGSYRGNNEGARGSSGRGRGEGNHAHRASLAGEWRSSGGRGNRGGSQNAGGAAAKPSQENTA